MFDWNDLRFMLAVERTGSTLAAARELRVSQTTVARRIAALERDLGLSLFERRQHGYALTETGSALLAAARRVEDAARAVAAAAAATGREIAGDVRLTVEEILATTILVPILGELRALHPGLRVELDVSDDLRDLNSGAADVALRSSRNAVGAGLVGRRLADDRWAFYCSRAYAETHGKPSRRKELVNHPIIGGGSSGIWRHYGAWLRQHQLEGAVAIRQGSISGLLASVKGGLGLGILPVLVAEQDPELVRCLPPTPPDERGLWLLTHERIRHTPRVRALMDLLGERIARLARASAV